MPATAGDESVSVEASLHPQVKRSGRNHNDFICAAKLDAPFDR